MSQEKEWSIVAPIEVQNPVQRCGLLIANHLRQGHEFLLDMDGVVVKPDSLVRPELTTPKIVNSIKELEDKGTKVGAATARGGQIVEYLRSEYGLQMRGSLILEDGHVLIKDGKTEVLAKANHSKFITDVRKELLLHPEFQTSWNNVKTLSEIFDIFAFCPGGFQWQGEYRASLWFFANGNKICDQEVLSEVFEPALRILAQQNELDYENDLDVSAGRMSVGNLGIISIKGKVNGLPVNKGIAAEKLTQPFVFAADGFGDTELAMVTKKFGGVTIGIEGNLDVSNEPPEFLRTARFVMKNPEEFAQALSYAASLLEKNGPS